MKTNRQYPFSTRPAWFTALLAAVTLLAAAPRSPAQTVWGNALSLDGVNQYVDVPTGGWFTNGDFTIEAWVYERSYYNWSRVIDFGNGQAQDNVLLALSNGTTGKPSFDVYPTNVQVVAPDPIPLNEWIHLAVTFQKTNSDSGTATIYVNGAAVVSGTVMAPNDVTRTDNYIGRSNWASDSYANAIFDDLRIWNVARSPQEIQADLAAPLTGTESNLVAYWKFDETNGTTAYDATTNHFDGTLVNGPVWVDSTVGELQATTLPATDVLTNGATLNGTVNPGFLPATAWFEWGTTTNYGNTTPPINLGATNVALTVSEPLIGLITGTTYHFRLDATNSLGSTFGDDLTFITPGKDLVTNKNDSGPGSLRDIIAAATSGAVITFSSSLSGQTIVLTSGELLLTKNLTIDASALPNGITIDGRSASRIFNVASGSTIELAGLTITNGYASGANGGGILNNGMLTMNECTIAGNFGFFSYDMQKGFHFSYGGGICNNGSMTLNQCTLAGNTSFDGGGGIYNSSSGTLTVNQCTIAGNASPSYSLFSSWLGGVAGGIYNVSGTVFLTNTIVAGNTASNSPNMYGPFSGANNLITSEDPMLAPLGNYGGSTPTLLPLPGSPAIDNGSDFTTNTFVLDQRGFPRLVNLQVDIGAVESAYPPTSPLAVTQPATGVSATVATLNATVTPNGAVTACHFEYGLTTNYGAYTATNTLSAGAAAVHVAQAGLLTGTLYHFRAVAGNGSGTTFGDDLTFSTGHLIFVTNTNDSGPGSLREAIASSGSGDDITFTNTLSDATIFLTSGELLLNNNLTIDGSALSNGIAIDGNGTSRILNVAPGRTIVLTALTITNGNTASDGGGIYNNTGTLTLNQCTVAGNSATTFAGGIYNYGDYIYGTTYGTLALNQCTIDGNSAVAAGGILNYLGTLTVNQCTIAGNAAAEGGGGMAIAQTNAPAVLINTIVAGNTAPAETNIYIGSGSFTGGNNLTNGDPLLAPLGDYGGPTQTMPPLPGSPAIDGCTNGTSFTPDQRGLPRIVGPFADIGAVEAQIAPADQPPLLMNSTWSALGGAGGASGFQFMFTSVTNADFTVLASTNLALPLTNWTVLGNIPQISSGQYQFTDPGATNYPQRFYQVISP